MMLTKLKSILAVALCAVGFAAFADVPQAITYHGVLMRQGGYAEKRTELTLTFSLYEGATSKVPVWARMIPVSIAQDGSFYTELRDDAGSVPTGVDGTKKLVDALAAMREKPEIGLTPPGAGEIASRQKLEMGVRAVRAVKARAADEVVCKSGISLEGARVGELKASQLTVAPGANSFAVIGNGKCTFGGAGERDVGGAGFVAGEGVTTNGFAAITDVGTVPNAFTYAFINGTEAANYSVSCVTGMLTIVAAEQAVRTVTLPAGVQGYTYVVSNLTAGAEAEIAVSGTTPGGATYDLPIGAKIAIYAVPAAGYFVRNKRGRFEDRLSYPVIN